MSQQNHTISVPSLKDLRQILTLVWITKYTSNTCRLLYTKHPRKARSNISKEKLLKLSSNIKCKTINIIYTWKEDNEGTMLQQPHMEVWSHLNKNISWIQFPPIACSFWSDEFRHCTMELSMYWNCQITVVGLKIETLDHPCNRFRMYTIFVDTIQLSGLNVPYWVYWKILSAGLLFLTFD